MEQALDFSLSCPVLQPVMAASSLWEKRLGMDQVIRALRPLLENYTMRETQTTALQHPVGAGFKNVETKAKVAMHILSQANTL